MRRANAYYGPRETRRAATDGPGGRRGRIRSIWREPRRVNGQTKTAFYPETGADRGRRFLALLFTKVHPGRSFSSVRADISHSTRQFRAYTYVNVIPKRLYGRDWLALIVGRVPSVYANHSDTPRPKRFPPHVSLQTADLRYPSRRL